MTFVMIACALFTVQKKHKPQYVVRIDNVPLVVLQVKVDEQVALYPGSLRREKYLLVLFPCMVG